MYVRVESVTNVVILCKRVEEDKIFQLLASLGPKYNILADSELIVSPNSPNIAIDTCN